MFYLWNEYYTISEKNISKIYLFYKEQLETYMSTCFSIFIEWHMAYVESAGNPH